MNRLLLGLFLYSDWFFALAAFITVIGQVIELLPVFSVNNSELAKRQAKPCEYVTIAFGFSSDTFRKRREIFLVNIKEECKPKQSQNYF